MQQAPDRRAMMTQMLIIWVISFVMLQMFFGRNQQAPAEAQSVLEQARKLEKEGRTAGSNIAIADRVKKLDQAAGKYEQFYNENKNKPEGWQARFNQINVYDYLANLEGKKAGTHWFDRAEGVLKDMEKALHGKTGSVEIERAGVRTRVEGSLSRIASERLNEIRAARDLVNRDRITYQLLDVAVRLCGKNPQYSYFLALLVIVVVLKSISFPFQKKQYKYTQDMMRIQPLIKEAQEKMKGRPPEELNKRMMQIYKENDVNIAAGCLPMLVMMIVIFPVFWMVRDYEYQFTNGHFLWVGSQYSQQVWWLADNLAQFDVPLFFLYLVSTVLYSLLQPKPADPQQAQQQRMMLVMMPLVFGVMMWQYQWSSAFMLYWLVLNLVSMYQSWVLMRQFPSSGSRPGGGGTPAPAVEVEAPGTPLEGMKGVHTRPGERKKRRRTSGTLPGGIRPRGIDQQS
jgi:YidC/Oxa1 family membrane protein insertase